MTISAACTATWAVLDGISGIARVYAIGKTGADAIPDAIGDELPAAIVYPDTMSDYQQSPSGGERHEYSLKIQLFVAGADTETRGNVALPLFDSVREAFQSAVALNDAGAGVNVARITGWRFGTLTYAGQAYLGWDITLFISEDGSVTYGR